MSDKAVMLEGTGFIVLAGPYLVKAAIGENIDTETLGGATTHNAISGIADYKFSTEHECLDQVKKIMSKLGHKAKAGFDRIAPKAPRKSAEEIYGIIPADATRPYDMLEIIERITDDSSFEQFKQDYGKTILCGY